MMIVACGRPSRSARITPVCAKPWSSDCRPVSIRSNCSSFIAAASAADDHERVGAASAVVLDVDGAVGAARQRLANHLRDARRSGRADDHFAAVLLLQPQRLFERVGVRLVHLEGGVLLADPGLVVVRGGAASRASGTCLMQTAIFMWSSGHLVIRSLRSRHRSNRAIEFQIEIDRLTRALMPR